MPSADHHVHVIGAGMAGLAAAVRCVEKGLRVSLYESANQAGGRCRSFHDGVLDRTIDNGNHLLLGGNPCVFDYLKTIGASSLVTPAPDSFPFIDLTSGESWTLRPGSAKLPLWLFLPGRRIPGTRISDYHVLKKLSAAQDQDILTDYVDPTSTIFERFWDPLCAAVLNTDAHEGSAKLIGRMLDMTLLKGPTFARPFLMPTGLSAALVDPALAYLRQRRVHVALGTRIKSLGLREDRAAHLETGDRTTDLSPTDHLILCIPPHQVHSLLPEVQVPTATRPILNVHYGLDEECPLPRNAAFIGVINGISQWIFRRGTTLSVTVSSAAALIDKDAEKLSDHIWQEVASVIGRPDIPHPPHRVIKEKRATICQTPAQIALRPDSVTRWKNLYLAGDWTNTGLPATIEGADQSGQAAADNLLNSLD